MSVSCGWLEEIMEEHASRGLAMEYDNVGLLVGDSSAEVTAVLTALDLTDDVLEEAAAAGAQMIVTHHPPIFRPLKKITADTALGRRLMRLIKLDIGLYAAHTNLDAAEGGTNDVLFDLLGLTGKEPEGLSGGIGRIGFISNEASLKGLAEHVKQRLGLSGLHVVGDGERLIRKVGICTGSGAEFISAAAAKGCDCYITGDVKYHEAQMAAELGLSLIDATHFATEVIIAESLRQYIADKAKEQGKELQVITAKCESNIFKLH